MTIGIYTLYYDSLNEVYVGQSTNIERRYKTHIRDLINESHTNNKLQNVYYLYGSPKLCILQICNHLELDIYEKLWTDEFNSIVSGLNIVEAGHGSGCGGFYQSNSKYSKLEILKAFRHSYLYEHIKLTHKQISEKLNIDESLIVSIRAGTTHSWLKEKYAKQYSWMQETKSKRNRALLDKEILLISPEGIIYKLTSITKFANEHSLDSGNLSRVIKGKFKQHKGWTKT